MRMNETCLGQRPLAPKSENRQMYLRHEGRSNPNFVSKLVHFVGLRSALYRRSSSNITNQYDVSFLRHLLDLGACRGPRKLSCLE
jgi:hypothetical protein